MKPVIEEIITREWDMFDRVNNISGRAPCQDDERSFRVMRGSQFEAWDDKTLESYLQDLQTASAGGRNLLTEKYGYMMAYTAPLEFEEIKTQLPEIPAEKNILIQKITRRQIEWYGQTARLFPLLASRGRPVHHGEGGMFDTSVEVYLIGELSTYSMDTLCAYDSYTEKLAAEGKNISHMILENTVKEHGYASVEETEAYLAKQHEPNSDK